MFDLITAIPVDLQNSWQAVNHSFTAQDVWDVYLSIIHKQLQERQTIIVFNKNIKRRILLTFKLNHQRADVIVPGFRPCRLEGRCRAGRRIRAASVWIHQAADRPSAGAATPPGGNELYSHPDDSEERSVTAYSYNSYFSFMVWIFLIIQYKHTQ